MTIRSFEHKCPMCGNNVDSNLVRSEPETRQISVRGKSVRLSPAQFAIFDVLLQRAPRKVTHDVLLEAAAPFGPSMARAARHEPGVSQYWAMMSKLRANIEPLGLKIVTTYNDGYALDLAGAMREPAAARRARFECDAVA